MSRLEVQPDETNISLEEQAKQQGVIADNSGNKVEINTAETTQQETATRPEWLPNKFKNAEDLAKAYSELEKKFSSKSEPKDPSILEARRLAEENQQASNTLEPFYKEYADNGSLSDKSYKELAKLGLDKNLVDGYIAGQKAIADNEVRAVYDSVGGQDNYQNVINWAKENLTETEQEAFNQTLDTGSLEQVKLAVKSIASFAGIGSSKPKMIEADTLPTSTELFESLAQVTQAMNDPRYEKDPAYRKQVEAKLYKSNVL